VELEHERVHTELEALQGVQTERDRLQTWIWEIEQELCAAQERVDELERRIEGLSQLNARLSLEKAGLQARLDSVGTAGVLGQESGQRVDAAMQHRLAELEEKISRVTTENALHVESTAELENLRVQLKSAARMREELRHDLVQALEKASVAEEAAADIITERDLLRELLGQRQPGVRGEEIGNGERAGAGSVRIEELKSDLVRLKEQLQSARAQASEGRHELLAELKRARDVRDKLAIELGRTQRELEKSADAAVQAGAARDRLRATLEGMEAQRAETKEQAGEEVSESGLAPPEMTGARHEAEDEDWRLGRQLREIKRLYDEGRIDREEVERRRRELLDEN